MRTENEQLNAFHEMDLAIQRGHGLNPVYARFLWEEVGRLGAKLAAQDEAMGRIATFTRQEIRCECIWPNGQDVTPCRGTCPRARLLRTISPIPPAAKQKEDAI